MLGRFHGGYHIMTQTSCSVLSLHNFPLTEFVMNLRTPSDSILAAIDRVELVGSLLRHDAWFPFGTFLRKVLFQTLQTWPNKQNAKTTKPTSTSLVTLSSLAEKLCSTHRCILVSSNIESTIGDSAAVTKLYPRSLNKTHLSNPLGFGSLR